MHDFVSKVLCISALAIATALQHPWPQFGASSSHASRGVSSGPAIFAPSVLWQTAPVDPRDVVTVIFSTAAVSASGAVYFSNYDGCVWALNAAQGATRWVHCLNDTDYLLGSPALSADGASVFATGDTSRSVIALDAASGAERWTFVAGGPFVGSPTLGDDGTVFAGSYDGNVYALTPGTGAQIWNWTGAAGIPVLSTPAVGPRTDGAPGSVVYVAAATGSLTALDAAAGQVLWSTAAWTPGGPLSPLSGGGALQSSPTLSDDAARIYIGTWDGALLCFNASSGDVVWRFNATAALGLPLAPVIIATPTLSARGVGPALVYSGLTFADFSSSSAFGTLFALDAATGALVWSTAVNCDIVTAPVVGVTNVLYIGVYFGDGIGAGGVAAYSGTDGTLLWKKPLGEQIYASPAMGADGTLYLGGTNGAFYALASSSYTASSSNTASSSATTSGTSTSTSSSTSTASASVSAGPSALPSSAPPVPPSAPSLSLSGVIGLSILGGVLFAVAALVVFWLLYRRASKTGGTEVGAYIALSATKQSE